MAYVALSRFSLLEHIQPKPSRWEAMNAHGTPEISPLLANAHTLIDRIAFALMLKRDCKRQNAAAESTLCNNCFRKSI